MFYLRGVWAVSLTSRRSRHLARAPLQRWLPHEPATAQGSPTRPSNQPGWRDLLVWVRSTEPPRYVYRFLPGEAQTLCVSFRP